MRLPSDIHMRVLSAEGLQANNGVVGQGSAYIGGIADSVKGGMIGQWLSALNEWLFSPQSLTLAIIWICIVMGILIIAYCLGFGPAGVVAGTAAAAFQSYAYGAFTPAGSIFAILTSMGMLGLLIPAAWIAGMVLATIVVIICGILGVGK